MNGELFLQLGIGGAALYVMYRLIQQMVTGITEKIGNSVDQLASISSTSINTLCDKIDKLVDANTDMAKSVVMLTQKSESENRENKKMLDLIYQNTRETKDSVEKIELILKK